MTEENPPSNPVLAWAKENQVPAIFIGLGVIVILGLLLSAVLGEDPEEVVVEITVPPDSVSTSTATADADSDRPEVPQVDCQILLTDDEIDEALFGPDPSGPRSHFTFSQGETCLYEPDDESGYYIKIEPGHPGDFDPDPRPLVVEGVGDAALWFDNGTDMGALSVGVNVPDASLIYRIHIGRPDMNSEERLAQATELALLALPRFPGTPPGPPEPLVDFCEMIPDEQAEEILSDHRDASPSTLDEVRVSDNSMGLEEHNLSEEGDPYCRKLILSEIYIEAQHGSLADFEDGARMEGVPAERIEGVGDEAVWFPNVPYQGSFTAPHERGLLAVRVGDAMFRIVIAVPDTPADDQLSIAQRLATGAIGLIPGAEAPEQEPQVVTFDEEPPDLPPQSLYDVVYEGVAAGDWTEGEGLAAALEWMLGDDQTFVEEELPVASATAIVREAQRYFASGAGDSEAVGHLLSQLMAHPSDLGPTPTASIAPTAGLLLSRIPIAQSEEEFPCEDCFLDVTANVTNLNQEKYSVYVAHPSEWDLDSVAITSFRDAVLEFESIASMPPTELVLAFSGGGISSFVRPSGTCVVWVGQDFNHVETNELLQYVAEETARCAIGFDLFLQLHENPNPWLEDGLVKYLGGVVWPNLNVEHKVLPGLLAQEELYTTIVQRRWTNWVFFEYLHSISDAQAVINLMRGLPESGDLGQALAGAPTIGEVFHAMGQALSDSRMPDIGGGVVPYGPKSWQVLLASPKQFDRELSMFSTHRYRLEVPPGRYACEVTVTSDGAQVSWRERPPGVPGTWSEDVPDTLEGTSVLLVTSVEEGATVSFEAGKTGDNPDCEPAEEEPWSPSGDPIEAILEMCDFICDPSSYYWEPREF